MSYRRSDRKNRSAASSGKSGRTTALPLVAGASVVALLAGTAVAWWKYNSYKKQRQEKRRLKQKAAQDGAAAGDGSTSPTPTTVTTSQTSTEESKEQVVETFVMPTTKELAALRAQLDSSASPDAKVRDKFFTAFRTLTRDGNISLQEIIITCTYVVTHFAEAKYVPEHLLTDEDQQTLLLEMQDLQHAWTLLQDPVPEPLMPHINQIRFRTAMLLNDPEKLVESLESMKKDEDSIASAFVGCSLLGRWQEMIDIRGKMSDEQFEFLNMNPEDATSASFDSILDLAKEQVAAGNPIMPQERLMFGAWKLCDKVLKNFRMECDDDPFRQLMEERAQKMAEDQQPLGAISDSERFLLNLQGAYASMPSIANNSKVTLTGLVSPDKISMCGKVNLERSTTYSSEVTETLELVRDEDYKAPDGSPPNQLAFKGTVVVCQEIDHLPGYKITFDVEVRFLPVKMLHPDRC